MSFIRAVLILLLLAPAARAEDRVVFQELGVAGFYSGQQSHPLKLRVSAEGPRRLRTLFRNKQTNDRGANIYYHDVAATGGKPIEVMLPVVPYGFGNGELLVELLDGEKVLSASRVDLSKPHGSGLVLMVCDDPKTCARVRDGILSAGSTREQNAMEARYTFHMVTGGADAARLTIAGLPRQWWGYTPASIVVLATSPAALDPAQRTALEHFVRMGGDLVLIEPLARGFLPEYPEADRPLRLGRGTLRRTASPSSLLGTAFPLSDNRSDDFDLAGTWQRQERIADYALGRLATRFAFPSFRAVMLWLGSYILIVGFVNFALLRRFRRLEWGWLTVPLIAGVFAALMYTTSAAKRPRNLALDEVTQLVLDDRSPAAYTEFHVRASSPVRRQVDLLLPPGAFISGLGWQFQFGAASVFDDYRQGQWEIELGQRELLKVPLLQWSYQDLGFHRLTQLPGTVVAANGRLRNQTGLDFRDALLLDKGEVYLLGAMANGQEVDLAQVTKKPGTAVQAETAAARHRQKEEPPFTVAELLPSSDLRHAGTYLLAWAKEAAPETEMRGAQPDRKAHTVLLVYINGGLQ